MVIPMPAPCGAHQQVDPYCIDCQQGVATYRTDAMARLTAALDGLEAELIHRRPARGDRP